MQGLLELSVLILLAWYFPDSLFGIQATSLLPHVVLTRQSAREKFKKTASLSQQYVFASFTC